MIDAGTIMRDQLVALAETEDRAAMGTTSEWWRAEIMRLVEDYDSFAEFLKRGEEEMMPMLAQSTFSMTILPDEDGRANPKFCMELGAAIMFDKPIIALTSSPGMKVPNQLRRIAHGIVEVDLNDPASREHVATVINGLLEQLREDGVIPPQEE